MGVSCVSQLLPLTLPAITIFFRHGKKSRKKLEKKEKKEKKKEKRKRKDTGEGEVSLEEKIEMIATAAITASTDPHGKESEQRKDETAAKFLAKVTGHKKADCTEFIAMNKLPGVSTIQAYYSVTSNT